MSLKRLLANEATTPEVAKEVYEQIIVCDDMCRPIPMEMIMILCHKANPTQVQIALHNHKFA